MGVFGEGGRKGGTDDEDQIVGVILWYWYAIQILPFGYKIRAYQCWAIRLGYGVFLLCPGLYLYIQISIKCTSSAI